jgi:iron complex outermembrane receptor protein
MVTMKEKSAFLRLILQVACMGAATHAAADADPVRPPVDPIVELDPYVIVGERDNLDPGSLPLDSTTVMGTGLPGIAARLADLPGISIASRGAFANEPFIRGLGFDRVATELNGLKLPNASPTRTHSPIGQVTSPAFRSITASRFLTTLASGPPVSGGRISLQSAPMGTGSQKRGGQPAAKLDFVWHPDREGHQAQAGLVHEEVNIAIRTSLDQSRFGNFTSGNGLEVPSRHESWGATISLLQGVTGSGWRHSLDGIYRRQLFTENAALPLDTDNGEFWALASMHTFQANDSEDQIRLRFGFTEADATLSNRRRPEAPAEVVTNTFASVLHADFQWILPLPDGSELAWGIDGNEEKRDAIRRRGPVAQDAIWPDIRYRQAGLYLQSNTRFSSRLQMRAEARLDYAESMADLENRIAFGNPLSSLFSQYNGTGADDSRQIDRMLSANLLVTFQPVPELSLYGGGGTSAQAPPPTERYRAFLNALGGGFELGNPALEPERKQELAIGAVLQSERLNLQADFYYFRIDDFIWRQRIGDTQGVLPTMPAPPVFGYRNVDAAFHGVEFHGTLRIGNNLHLPFSFSWNQGELSQAGPGYQSGDALPEIPPLEIRAGARYRFRTDWGEYTCQWMIRHTGSGRNELPNLSPLYVDTASYTRHDLSLSLIRRQNLSVEISLLNVFDETIYPYLSPPVSSIRPASGDLSPGDRVPAPGRELVVSLGLSF